jgi:hypothetical protein
MQLHATPQVAPSRRQEVSPSTGKSKGFCLNLTVPEHYYLSLHFDRERVILSLFVVGKGLGEHY